MWDRLITDCHVATMVAEPVVPVLRGDMTEKWVLQEAGVERASAVFVLTPDGAVERELADLPAAIADVERLVTAGQELVTP